MFYHIIHDSWGVFSSLCSGTWGTQGACNQPKWNMLFDRGEKHGQCTRWSPKAVPGPVLPWWLRTHLGGNGATAPRQPHSWECSWWGCLASPLLNSPSVQRGWGVLNKPRTQILKVHYFESSVRVWIHGIEFQISWFPKGSVVFLWYFCGISVPSCLLLMWPHSVTD